MLHGQQHPVDVFYQRATEKFAYRTKPTGEKALARSKDEKMMYRDTIG
jgi:hypothetical protein